MRKGVKIYILHDMEKTTPMLAIDWLRLILLFAQSKC